MCCRYPAHEPLQGICLVRRRLKILRSLHCQRRLQQGAGCLGFPAVLRMQAAKQHARTTLCCGQHSFTIQQPTCVFSTMASRTVDSSACAGAQAHLPSRCGPYASASFASCRPKPTYGCLTLLHDIATRTCPVHTLQRPTLPFPFPPFPPHKWSASSNSRRRSTATGAAHPHSNVKGATLAVHMATHDGSSCTLRPLAPRPRSCQQQPPRKLQAPGRGVDLLMKRLQQGIGAKPMLRRHRLQQLAVARRQQDGGLSVLDDGCPALRGHSPSDIRTGVLFIHVTCSAGSECCISFLSSGCPSVT